MDRDYSALKFKRLQLHITVHNPANLSESSIALVYSDKYSSVLPCIMLAPAPRGRILAIEVLIVTSFPQTTQLLIVVKTTRFDDGHVMAWYIEQDGLDYCWPTRTRLDPSLLHTDTKHNSSLGVMFRKSLVMAARHLCLDELEMICLRAPLPDSELGEDQYSWCFDVLLTLERLQCLAFGQTLALEEDICKLRLSLLNQEHPSVTEVMDTSFPKLKQETDTSKRTSVTVF